MYKKCNTCSKVKGLSEFFCATQSDRASEVGTSKHCIQCHNEGRVEHGYGWYGDKYKTPDFLNEEKGC